MSWDNKVMLVCILSYFVGSISVILVFRRNHAKRIKEEEESNPDDYDENGVI